MITISLIYKKTLCTKLLKTRHKTVKIHAKGSHKKVTKNFADQKLHSIKNHSQGKKIASKYKKSRYGSKKSAHKKTIRGL